MLNHGSAKVRHATWDTVRVSSSHYFSESPSSPAKPRDICVTLAGETYQVTTSSGVFSPEQLDRGTSVLLRQVPDPPAVGDILDIGCGWGPITLDAALRAPQTRVWGVDVNERSLALTKQNAERLGLTQVRVARPEDVPASMSFAEIRSNPPIRVGKQQLHELLETWLPRLVPGGAAYLVVAKHLGAESLQAWITKRFAETHEVDRYARDKGFHIIEVLARERESEETDSRDLD